MTLDALRTRLVYRVMSKSRIGATSLPSMSRMVLPAILCALLSPNLGAGVIRVTLRDEHGSCLSGIRLVLSGENDGDFRPRFLETNVDGIVSFDEVPEGQ